MSKKGRAATLDRKSRLEAVKKEQARAARKRTWLIAAIAGPLVVIIVVLAGVAIHQASSATLGQDIAGLQTFTGLGRNHVTAPTYKQVPPVGGDHLSVWQNCGVYDTPINDGNGVHSLEHGAVWITYQPDLPADQVAKLTSAAKGQAYVLVSPYPNLPAPVVASAWGYQVKLTSASDPRLDQFIRAFEQGPQTPEPGAACVGGTGTPVQSP
jgi:hypothetical protein